MVLGFILESLGHLESYRFLSLYDIFDLRLQNGIRIHFGVFMTFWSLYDILESLRHGSVVMDLAVNLMELLTCMYYSFLLLLNIAIVITK